MKSLFGKATAFLLVMCMLLAGCGSEQKKEEAAGRYVEQDVTLPDVYQYYFMSKMDGSVSIFELLDGGKLAQEYELKEGKCVKGKTFPIRLPSNPRKYLAFVEIQKDHYCIYINDNNEVIISKYSNEGELVDICLMENDKPLTAPIDSSKVIMDEAGNVYFQPDWHAAVKAFDGKTGKLVHEYPRGCTSMALCHDKLYMMIPDEQKIKIYDTKTYQCEKTIDYISARFWQRLSVNQEDGSIFLFDEQGIRHHLYDGNLWETVVDPRGMTLSMTSYEIGGGFERENEFYVWFYIGNDIGIKRYYFDPDASLKIDAEVRVFMPYENELLKQAITIYEKKHPNILVTTKIGSSHSTDDHEAMVKELNAQMLADDGPDLLLMDGMPYKTYMQQGLLEDVSDIAVKFDNDWVRNVVQAFQKDGKNMAVPMRFRPLTVWGSEELVDSVHSLHDLAEYKRAHPEEILFNKSALELFAQTSQYIGPTLVDEQGRYSREKCQRYIEDITALSEKPYRAEDRSGYCFRVDLEEQNKYEELLRTAYKDQAAFLLMPRNTWDLAFAETALGKRGEGNVVLLEADGKGIFEAEGILGINAKSKHKECAKEIMSIAVSDEVEIKGNWLGLPISKNALKVQANRIAGAVDTFSDNEGRQLHQEIGLHDLYDSFIEKCSHVSVCANHYEDITAVLQSYLGAYARGELTMQKALDKIDETMPLKMAEEDEGLKEK